jgi:hypothetical protein
MLFKAIQKKWALCAFFYRNKKALLSRAFLLRSFWDENENEVPDIRLASTPLSHRWLSGVEAISLGTLICRCSISEI